MIDNVLSAQLAVFPIILIAFWILCEWRLHPKMQPKRIYAFRNLGIVVTLLRNRIESLQHDLVDIKQTNDNELLITEIESKIARAGLALDTVMWPISSWSMQRHAARQAMQALIVLMGIWSLMLFLCALHALLPYVISASAICAGVIGIYDYFSKKRHVSVY